MKLLSMRLGGQDRSGIIIGSEALDVSAIFSTARLEDALDLFTFGVEELLDLAARISATRT